MQQFLLHKKRIALKDETVQLLMTPRIFLLRLREQATGFRPEPAKLPWKDSQGNPRKKSLIELRVASVVFTG
jgi:hypothetical protein